jgi:transposase InsO family protein
LAVLGITLTHSKPGQPAGRGKIERFLCATRRPCAVRRWRPKEVQVLLAGLSQQPGRS